jgi:hypothetical protein
LCAPDDAEPVLAVIYNTIALAFVIASYVTALIATVAMSGSLLLVTLNAVRVRTGSGLRRALRVESGLPFAEFLDRPLPGVRSHDACHGRISALTSRP